MDRDPRLEIMTEAIERLIPGATPAFLAVTVTETAPGTALPQHTWTGTPEGLATKVFTALYGRPRTEEQRSPLAQAEDAKRARDLDTEVSVLNGAYEALTTAPWYPCRPGDLVHVHHEATPRRPAYGETYVIADVGDQLMSMQLLAHTFAGGDTEAYGVGCFAAEAADDPVIEAWFEAGPHLLTIVRDGRPVHAGGAR